MRMDKFLPFLIAVLIHALPLSLLMLKKSSEQAGTEVSTHLQGIDLSGFSTHKKTTPVKSASSPAPEAKASGQSAQSTETNESGSGTEAETRSTSIILSSVGPVYPPLARQNNLEGKVKLRAHYNAEGIITQVDIIESSGTKILDESAKHALSAWKIKSGMAGSFEKTFQFRLND